MRIRRILARALHAVQPPLLRVCVRIGVLADLYYVFSGAFRREHRGVLDGRWRHLRQADAGCAEEAQYALRRCIHRIEKGLIMRPRRDIFALEYIGDAVGLFEDLVAAEDCGDTHQRLLAWSMDVLSRYFDAVRAHPRIDSARPRFAAAVVACQRAVGDCAPYHRAVTALPVRYEDLLELAQRRRSCRWYLQEAVPRELIDRAMTVARLSPSACNRQPFEFRVFDDMELARRVGAIPMGTRGFSDNFPCLVVIVGRLRAFPFDRDRHVIYIDASLAAMAFQFALEVQGLSSCCINWPDIPAREDQMRRMLHLAPDERVIMCLSVGYPEPEGMVPYSQKKSLDELRSYNRT